VRLRSTFATVLAALIVLAAWSAAMCETSCVLPHDKHACCADPARDGKPGIAQLQGCERPVRTVAVPPVVPVAMAPVDVRAVPVTPGIFAVASDSQIAIATASPPKINLRI